VLLLCFKLWDVLFVQEDRKTALPREDFPEMLEQKLALSAFLSVLTWEHPRKGTLGPRLWAPRAFICPMEIADIMDRIKIGRQNALPPELDLRSQKIAGHYDDWARNVGFKPYSHEEALQLDSAVAHWISFAKNAALGAHTHILEDGPELPRVLRPHAEVGGEVLEGTYTEGCSSLRDSRIHHGRAEVLGTVSGMPPDTAGIVSKDPRVAPTGLLDGGNSF
jgi:hypothetical protein